MEIRKIEVIDKVNNESFYLPETVHIVVHPETGDEIRLSDHRVEGMYIFGIIFQKNGVTDLCMKKCING